MKSIDTSIATCTLLRTLPLEVVHSYYKSGRIHFRTYSKGEIIHLEGDPCTQMEIIITGNVEIQRIDLSGNVLTVTDFNPGDNLGANLIFSSYPVYPMTALTTKSTQLLILDKTLISELCTLYPSFMEQFLQVISNLSLFLSVKVKNHINRTIRESMVAYINKQMVLQKNSTITIHVSKKALAERMGVSRTSLSRELQKIKSEGFIDFDTKTITVLDDTFLK